MKVVGGMGNVGDFPVKGAAINLDTADMTQLIAATSGLVKTLAITGGIGVAGIAILSALVADSQSEEDPKMPISILSKVTSGSRSFIGICQNRTLDFICDNQDFSVDLGRLNTVKENSGFFLGHYGYRLTLIDGSSYTAQKLLTNELRFYSVAGEQSVFSTQQISEAKWVKKKKPRFFGLIEGIETVREYGEVDKPASFSITGVTLKEIQALKMRLKYAIEQNIDNIVHSVGKDTFNKYFQ
jgi:hypothetical protein